MPGTREAGAWLASLFGPVTSKPMQGSVSVEFVMHAVGLDEVPMMPTIREETVTKKNPKTTMSSDISRDCGKGP